MLQTVFPTSNLNTHSFRIGGAAAAAGIQDSAIQLLGRWSGDAYCRYLHLSDYTVIGFSHRLFATNNFFITGIQCTAVHRLIMNMEKDYSY